MIVNSPSPHFQSECVLRSKISLFQTENIWVLFLFVCLFSILIPYVFCLEHLVHLHLVLLLKDMGLESLGCLQVSSCSDVSGTLWSLQNFTHRVLLRISCRAILVVMNSFSFCLFGKTFISPSILNDRLLNKGFLAAYFICSSH